MIPQSPRYLTKSRFKVALECPTKLFYTKKDVYPDIKEADPFLEALADGGMQVGELARAYYPGGRLVEAPSNDLAEKETKQLLKAESVVIFEPAIRFQNLFVRIDVLVKRGNYVELIEVKAKSFDPEEEFTFCGPKGGLDSGWRPYLYDLTFQKYVLENAYPEYVVSPYLMLADKSAPCPTEGLNQKFSLSRDASSPARVKISVNVTPEDLDPKILAKVNANRLTELVLEECEEKYGKPFPELVKHFSEHYLADIKLVSPLGSKCKSCEFRCTPDVEALGKRSGYKECFKEALGWSAAEFEKPTVLDLWDNRRKDKHIEAGILFLDELTEEDISLKGDGKPGLSRTERQWVQINKVRDNDPTPYIDRAGLETEIIGLRYPLHFIDFETAMVPIPFNKGRRPYEQVAFQFSHHLMQADGSFEHKSEFLSLERGKFPNFDFIRALKNVLENDSGTIFRYATHENTVLNQVREQIKEACLRDAEELCAFIETISKSKNKSSEVWEGARNMADLQVWVKRYYYNPHTGGSNSIKYVLPAILNTSTFLKEKYCKPIYGAQGGIYSKNFTGQTWIEFDGSKVRNPYTLLGSIYEDYEKDELERLYGSQELADGGAALTAYARMQCTKMEQRERKSLEKGLLRYCELDTLAMVMLFEGLKEAVQ